MPDQADFPVLFEETEDSIQDRFEQTAEADIDKRPGEIFHDLTYPVVVEITRLWDALNTTLATGFVPFTFGQYLDYKGEFEMGIPRKAATAAVGEVTFTGVEGVMISSGTSVTTTSDDPSSDEDLYRFDTVYTDKIGITTPLDVLSAAVTGVSGMTKTVSYKFTFEGRGGETAASPATAPLAVTNQNVLITNIPVGPTGTTARKIYRQEGGTGPYRLLTTIANNTAVSHTDTTTATLASNPEPAANTTYEVTIPVQAVATGKDYNVAIEAVDQLVTIIDGVTSVTNREVMTGGSDEENDEDYSTRLVNSISSPSGQGNVADYNIWATSVAGVENASVVPLWDGPNTVQVVLVGPDNAPTPASVIDEVQQLLDPGIDGTGQGLAPIGATVTVVTADVVDIDLVAVVTHLDGFTLDGTDGTSATRQPIIDSVNNYLQGLSPGSDVIWSEVVFAIMNTTGVFSVAPGMTLNASTANVVVASDEVAQLDSVTLT